jgi:hypothetical protein
MHGKKTKLNKNKFQSATMEKALEMDKVAIFVPTYTAAFAANPLPESSLPTPPSNANIALVNEYGKNEMLASIQQALHDAGFGHVEALHVSLLNYAQHVERLEREQSEENKSIVVLNLCDGTEEDGYPGLKYVQFQKLARQIHVPKKTITNTKKKITQHTTQLITYLHTH